jgi:Kef-type K+ transport system membrane component KefB
VILLHLLLALAAVIVVGRLFGRICRALNEPPVIGEVIAGIALGPSLLGRVSPEAYAFLLPASIAPTLNVVAQIGIAVYMFLVGLELNLDRVRWRARSTIAISNAGIVAPFLLGLILASYLYPRLSTSDVPFASFALFIGTAMSITAFPVLARILADRKLAESDLGAVALTSAAVDDVSAWCLLAVVVGATQARVQTAWVVAVLAIAYILFMLAVARPFVARAAARVRRPAAGTIAIAFVGLLLSASITQLIGIHTIFGAFLFGAIIPHESVLSSTLVARLKTPVTIFLLPAFFAFAGMRTRVDLLATQSDWLICGLIVFVASAGKIGGCCAAARATGMTLRDSVAVALLMNTRGLMELIVVNIGLDLGVISPVLFTMLVLMALVTTLATSPLLDLIAPRDRAVESTA